jgi:hypothetical protein
MQSNCVSIDKIRSLALRLWNTPDVSTDGDSDPYLVATVRRLGKKDGPGPIADHMVETEAEWSGAGTGDVSPRRSCEFAEAFQLSGNNDGITAPWRALPSRPTMPCEPERN